MAPSGSPATADAELDWAAPYRVDLRAVLGSFQRGGGDHAMAIAPDGATWRTARTPDGPATLRLTSDADRVHAQAWGPGSAWLVASVPSLLGAADDAAGFPAELLPASLQSAWRRYMGRWRVPRSARVVEALAIAVLEQKVTGVQSRRAWQSLLAEVGEAAPGPTPRPMRVFPEAARLRRVPSWQWHRWGVAPQQSAALLRAVQSPGRIEECADLDPTEARTRLTSIPGIGGWTAAEVAQRALGDPDAVSFGDYHLAKHVVYAFTGAADGTDERMNELLEPFTGHRYRVQRIVELSGISRPARGPRMTIADHRRI
jgi:3-methyladenine DNA glycosylase/8-oxoguanine DNA glycosylase